MANSGIRIHHLRLPNRGDTRHMYYTSHQRLCNLRTHKTARHEQNQKKEKNAHNWIEYFPFEKVFRRKITENKNMAVHYKMGWEQYHI